MHSATAIGAGRGEYYLSLGRDDYYLEGGEPPGHWYGQGCEELGVSGQVEKTEFRNLLAGRSADCRDELVRKQHFIKSADGTQKEACAAYDLHFSVPKSVSVLWAMAPDEARRQIASCHDRAVKVALDLLQDEAIFGRKGKGGTESLSAKMAVAVFQHGASRALDPQLHHHAVVLNIACCEDKTRALDGRHLYRWQKAIGSIYDAELARLLHEELGLQAVKKGQSFEVNGVSERACEVFSKRRAEILEVAGQSAHPAVREIAALETRESKAHVSDEKRREMWLEIGPTIDFGRRDAELLLGTPRITLEQKEGLKEDAFQAALQRLSKNESHFNIRDFHHALSQEAQSRHLGPMVQEARAYLSSSPEVIKLGLTNGELRYATRELWDVEAGFLQAVENSLNETRHKVDIYAFGRGLQAFENEKSATTSKTFRLNYEQLEAVREITLEAGSVKAITGMAGTGKTTMLGAATRIWSESGLDVIGAALAGKAATGLKEETGMEAASVAKTLSLIERGRLTITERTVLVVDEAAMVDTYKAAKITELVTRAGGKLVLVGDSEQLQAIGPGGAFQAVVNRIGESHHKTLTQITRQNREEDRETVKHFAKGEAAAALRSYAERGLVNVSSHSTQAMKRLIDDWEKHGGASEAKNHLIITGTREVTSKLNAAAQERSRLAGILGDRNIVVEGKAIFERDRILFTYTSQGFDNGTLGTVERVDRAAHAMTVLLDSGKRVYVDLRRYDHVDLGYAITTHRGQGCTVQKNAYILVGGRMQDLHLSYVQASRAKEDTRFYTTKRDAGDNLTRLAASMSRDRQKHLAHDIPQLAPRLDQSI